MARPFFAKWQSLGIAAATESPAGGLRACCDLQIWTPQARIFAKVVKDKKAGDRYRPPAFVGEKEGTYISEGRGKPSQDICYYGIGPSMVHLILKFLFPPAPCHPTCLCCPPNGWHGRIKLL